MATDYLCNLVIPGAGKSGTSSLHDYLNTHPHIAMSTQKEPHHFCDVTKYQHGAEAHNALFNRHPEIQYYGESSTGYLPLPTAAKRILHDLASPKVIMALRHPVARCFSHYRWRYRLGLEKRSFLAAMTEDGYGYDPEKSTKYGYMAYLEFSNYATHCPVWEHLLGEENCLILAAEHMLADHEATLNRCFEFLNVEPIAQTVPTAKRNETDTLGRRPPKAATRLARLLPKGIRSSGLYQKAKVSVLRAAAPVPPTSMTEGERAYVTSMLANDIAWYESKFAMPDMTRTPEHSYNRD
jgi:hypothetical protein